MRKKMLAIIISIMMVMQTSAMAGELLVDEEPVQEDVTTEAFNDVIIEEELQEEVITEELSDGELFEEPMEDSLLTEEVFEEEEINETITGEISVEQIDTVLIEEEGLIEEDEPVLVGTELGAFHVKADTGLIFPKNVENMFDLPITVTAQYTEASRFIELLNQKRAEAGLQQYVVDSALTKIAWQRAAETCLFCSHNWALGTNNSAGPRYVYANYPKITYGVGENIGVGYGGAESVYSGWINSTGHAPLLIGNNYVCCGVAAVDYEGTRYWVLLTCVDNVENNIYPPTGVAPFSAIVKTTPEYIIPTRATYSIYYGENNSTEPLRITNRGQNQGIAKGYPVTDPSAINAVSNNPEIFTVRPNGTIQPTGVGTGTMTVSLYGSAPVTISVIVNAQPNGGINGNSFTEYFDGKLIVDNDNLLFKPSGLSYEFTGSEIKPPVSNVKDCFGNVLKEGIDYSVEYKNNIYPGTGRVQINGLNNYAQTGIIDGITFEITAPDPTITPTPTKPTFTDVTDQTKFYYDPIYWAADNGIVTGYEDNTFRSYNNCNRAAVVTFLWRLAGKPDYGITNTFSDMTGNDDFDRAITWASKEGITTGFDDGTFRPWVTCNRAAIVTFLWRYAGKPEPSSMASFSDMTGNADFNKAISWAAENGITTGYDDGTFRPWNQCLRLAVVTFLYRFANL